ncbi:MAG TPA: electron transport complex subunit RsxC [Myxococcota bacterium]|nr:electron transport complex subunit RsxC [Myxococcota bacterium]
MSSPTFEHGVHPHDDKGRTAHLAVRRMPFGQRFVMLLGQHIGAPSKPLVDVGDEVRRGQLIASPGGFVSTSLHSPVTGRVRSVQRHRHPTGSLLPAIEIEADPWDSQELVTEAPEGEDFVELVQAGGIVGLGGAAFPSHVKYSLSEGRRCKDLVLNGCECEPLLTSDHRTMVEQPDRVLRGVELVVEALGAERAVIGVEENKPDAVAALLGAMGQRSIKVQPVQVKYPQGAEKMLIHALFGVEVPAGKLPLDLEMVVNNVSTMAAIADWIELGIPLIDRTVTVSGPAVARPANLRVPIGTPIRDVLAHCGAPEEGVQIVMGGPMMGMPVTALDAPVLKGTSGLLVFREGDLDLAEAGPCIRCGRCLEACGYKLNPSLFGRLARAGFVDEMENWNVLDCMECGACTWACPSEIPLVQLIRSAKRTLRSRK